MNPKPTGRLRGDDLVLSRTFRAPIDDVWTSVTSSESTARWFGPWERASDDKKIRIQMAHEEGKPWLDGTIEHCEAPHHLAVRTKVRVRREASDDAGVRSPRRQPQSGR